MKNHPISMFLLVALSAATGHAWADKADRNKPMNIEADSLRYDDVRQVSVAAGRVVITKGSIVMRGERIEIRQDAEGYQYGVVTSATDSRAFFRQKRDALDEFIEGEGDSIEYDGKADTVRFVQKAQLRRLRGSAVADEITGAVIVYDNLTDRFTVDGNAGKPVAGAPAGRVRAMLTPKPEAAPAAAASQPAPALRATTTLGGPPR
ncbi:MAG: lipopolysaccharide transport periplasmic protein LptA [Pseudomonas fluorescens]|nr:lipopolysaccharide transport periplasmic protein LptA [Pseudomonas fluorescens]